MFRFQSSQWAENAWSVVDTGRTDEFFRCVSVFDERVKVLKEISS